MRGFLCIAAFLLLGSLAGCGASELFKVHDVPESEAAAAAPWPSLADTPAAPPKGEYGPGVPDPAKGAVARAELTLAAEEAAARAQALQIPPLTEADLRRLKR